MKLLNGVLLVLLILSVSNGIKLSAIASKSYKTANLCKAYAYQCKYNLDQRDYELKMCKIMLRGR